MKRSSTLLLLAIALCAATANVAPAASDTAARIATALSALDPTAVPTGRLYDRVLPLAAIDAHDGRAGASAVTAPQWRQMLDEMRRATFDTPDWPDGDAAREAGRAAAPGAVTIGLLDVAYARLRPDATAAGLLAREGDRFVPAAGVDQRDLYQERRLFAAAALGGRTAHGARVDFTLPRRFLISDGGAPARLELDAADGRGFRPLFPDAPLAASYDAPGRRVLRLRLTRGDGAVLESAFALEVTALAVPAPTATWPLTGSQPYQGATATGEAYLYLADGHAVLTDPVVVVEGFDLDNSMGWDELYQMLNRENLLEDLRAAGRDAVVLNFTDSTEPVERNAFVLTALLAQVEATIAPQRDYVVIGASMGGLVARYALAWLETQGTPARARSFISFDVPHGGADIPLGLQYWLDFFQDQSTDAAYLLSRLDTPAARQLLLYHHTTPPGPTGQPDPLRAGLLADFAAVGGWPQRPRLVAVANGSGARADQGFVAGAQLIRYEYNSFLVDIRGNVWAVPDATSLRVFQGLIDLLWPLPDTSMNVTVSGTLPWDGAPGGYRASLAQMDTTAVPYGDIVALHPNHCFIPTVSALALPAVGPFFDIAGTPGLLALTPFDAAYWPVANQEHVLVTPENEVWLRAEIDRAPTAVPAGGAPTPVPVALAGRPNPFNPATTLRFTLPAAGRVELAIHDAAGRRVRTLLAADLPAGPHAPVWRGDDDAGRPVPAGVYLVVLRTAAGTATAKLAMVK